MTEIIATLALVWSRLCFRRVRRFPHRVTSRLRSVSVGHAGLGAWLCLGGPTGYAMNPARDFGPRLAHVLLPIAGKGKSDWGYALVPILGPLVGGAIAAISIHLIKY